VALPAPTEREKSQMYVQRYMRYFPAAGEVVIFDRSWYKRAGVERVMGFCTEDQTSRFLEMTPLVERAMVDSGIILVKSWLEVSSEEQTRRLEGRIEDGRKVWKLTPMDLKSYSRWYDCSRSRDTMFAATDTAWAPWYVAPSDDKKWARLNIISHLLGRVPYEELPRQKVTLPKRQKAKGYREPDDPFMVIPAAYRDCGGPYRPEFAPRPEVNQWPTCFPWARSRPGPTCWPRSLGDCITRTADIGVRTTSGIADRLNSGKAPCGPVPDDGFSRFGIPCLGSVLTYPN
jgi:hypothetical protein